jgi:diguanylate cyclase (GGDEF)-like protein
MNQTCPTTLSKRHTFLVVLTACALTLVVTALAATIALNTYHATVGRAGKDARFISSLVATQMSLLLLDIEGNLGEVAMFLETQIREHPDDHAHRLQDLLASIRHGEFSVQELLLTDAQGRIEAWTGLAGLNDVFAMSDYKALQAGTTAPLIGAPVPDAAQPGTWVFAVSRGLRNDDGELTHVVTAIINLETLQKAYAGLDMPPGTGIVVSDLEGRVYLARPGRESYLGRVVPELVTYMGASPQGGIYVGPSPVEDSDLVAGSTRVARFPLMVFAIQPLDQALSPWRQHALFYGGASLALILVAAALSTALVRSQAQITCQNRALAQAASTDPLTGALNRRSFLEAARREFSRVGRYGGPLACVMMDLDHFKRINDTHGHPAGDLALSSAARFAASRLRRADLFCRYGGEEFVFLLPGTDLAGAVALAESLRQGLSGLHLEMGSERFTFTASFGVAELHPDTPSLDDLLVRADRALYLAKLGGRDQVRTLPADTDSANG